VPVGYNPVCLTKGGKREEDDMISRYIRRGGSIYRITLFTSNFY
jgi:hypothetical protein